MVLFPLRRRLRLRRGGGVRRKGRLSEVAGVELVEWFYRVMICTAPNHYRIRSQTIKHLTIHTPVLTGDYKVYKATIR